MICVASAGAGLAIWRTVREPRWRWRSALLHALPVMALVLYLFYHWFAIADRHIVFLYYHDMGPLYPDTSPFSAVTSSRYWMSGLVASGSVMMLYAAASWLLGRLAANYRSPAWWRVWALCAVPLLIGIPLITMTVNQPTLPLLNAAQTTLATLIGLALALMPGKMAAERPGDLVLLIFDGCALMLVLLNIIGIEEVDRWLANGRTWWLWMMVVGSVSGVVWLLIMTGLRAWWRTSIPSAAALFTAGLCVAYPLTILIHYVSFTDGYYYISDMDNFFARNIVLQIMTWLIIAALALGVTRLREYLVARRAKPQANRT
jgi:hypothetical protein